MARNLTNKFQLSGWRLVNRRISQATTMRDTRMLSDPFSPQTIWFSGGIGVSCAIVLFGFLLGIFSARGADQGDAELILTKSAGRYVVYQGSLHEVTNLASARLIVGNPKTPKVVKDEVTAQWPPGQLMGIVSAPDNLTARSDEIAQWTVCDRRSDETELSLTKADSLSTTLIAGVGSVSDAVSPQPANDAVLVKLDAAPDELWMVYKGQRTLIGARDLAARAALALSPETIAQAIPISEGLFNAIPAAPALTAPYIADRGAANPILPNLRNGDIIITASADGTRHYQVALAGGVQSVSELIAQLLINTGSNEISTMDRQQLAKVPLVSDINLSVYPDQAPNFRQPHILCWQWQKGLQDQRAVTTILTGSALPLSDTDRKNVIALQRNKNPAATANASFTKPGAGWFVYVTTGATQSHVRGQYSFITDKGIRYPIGPDKDPADVSDDKGLPYTETLSALGLTSEPLPIPWEIAKLYATGSTLSRQAALTLHGGQIPDDLNQTVPGGR